MFFANKYRYLFLLGLSVYAYLNTAFCEVYMYFNIPIQWYYAQAVILLITFFVWEVGRLTEPLFYQWLAKPEQAIRRGLLFFFTCFVLSSLFTVIQVVLVSKLSSSTRNISLVNPLKLTLTYAALINLLFHLLSMIFYYQQQYRKQLVEWEEMKKINAQAELYSVKQQINPHFLFNNLNVLSGLVMQKSSEANHFIEAFSKVYMHILNTQYKELVSLKNELNFLQPYTYLLQQRFPGGVSFEINVPDALLSYYVVPVCLQMLVENAVKHNVVSDSKPLRIKIYSKNDFSLSVENNVQPRVGNPIASGNVGLSNIKKRYELTTGRDVEIAKSDTCFTVTLPLIQISANESDDY